MPLNVFVAGRASSPGKQTVTGSILKPGTFVRWRFGHEKKNSTTILSLPLIQEGQLSVTGKRMCTKYWLPKNSVDRLTDRARNGLKCQLSISGC